MDLYIWFTGLILANTVGISGIEKKNCCGFDVCG